MDPLSIGIMLLGAAMSAKATNDAAQKQQRLAMESRQRALQAQNQATDVAMKRVQEFDPTVRKAQQDEIQTQLTDKYQQAATPAPLPAPGMPDSSAGIYSNHAWLAATLRRCAGIPPLSKYVSCDCQESFVNS